MSLDIYTHSCDTVPTIKVANISIQPSKVSKPIRLWSASPRWDTTECTQYVQCCAISVLACSAPSSRSHCSGTVQLTDKVLLGSLLQYSCWGKSNDVRRGPIRKQTFQNEITEQNSMRLLAEIWAGWRNKYRVVRCPEISKWRRAVSNPERAMGGTRVTGQYEELREGTTSSVLHRETQLLLKPQLVGIK